MTSVGPTDAIDLRILELLQADARLSLTEIGRRVALSRPAVTERIRRLEDNGVITGYHIEIDFAKLGRPVTALIRISTSGAGCQAVEQYAHTHPEIVECYRSTGNDCITLKAIVATVKDIEAILVDLRPYGQPTTAIVLATPLRRSAHVMCNN